MSSRDESHYPKRREGDAVYYTRRILYDDLAVVIRRFPAAETAPTTARPFVLVPGIGVSSRYFHPAAARLARHAPVYLVELPGFGASPNPHRTVTMADHAAVLQRYLSSEHIAKPVLVGHSMGTQVITRLALDFPQVSDRLVLLAPTMDPAARGFWHATARLLRDVFVAEHPAVLFIVSIDYFFRCGVPWFLTQTKQLLTDRIEDRLAQVSARTLVVRGDNDDISPLSWCTKVAELLPVGAFASVKGPHCMWWSDPDRVTELIVEHASD